MLSIIDFFIYFQYQENKEFCEGLCLCRMIKV